MSTIGSVGNTSSINRADSASTMDVSSLSTSALITYFGTRINDISAEMRKLLGQEEVTRDVNDKISQVEATLSKYPNGINTQLVGQPNQITEEELTKLYANMDSLSETANSRQTPLFCPTLTGRSVLVDKLNGQILAHQRAIHAAAKDNDKWQDSDFIKPNNPTPADIKSLTTALDGMKASFSTESTMRSVQIQDLASKLQMATQLATNLVNVINESAKAPINNIGRG